MPHIIVEVSQKFDKQIVNNIIQKAQEYLINNLPTKLETFKNRVYVYDSCMVGGLTSEELIHLTIKILSGRRQEHLVNIANQLRSLLAKYLDTISLETKNYTLTLEILELAPAYVN
ncbi:hypothetical protein IB642_01665 [Allofrancisella guangzhouensis]|uniref:5-carboxymethyl-2-hydroxymuconate isomerase n=1 Tax=Allofrancisella guangzhouensis TaxID=594679 RepID=A0A0A8E5H5_9GAMM|nr:hypothetical protein [Allofrancisella guangzhouensis]AJC49204.1 hypothetical protein SD28_05940 [Allofrancisella guangzhouensis]MBK2027318.1 hypothetical protein [Allofrancisella guangzhouensis]MBK2043724.1 hypothetical protein [Allofrancisella guangzhouensis]MBK2045316.1 hypothetical protein [Allofrancisella guangzhouensis]